MVGQDTVPPGSPIVPVQSVEDTNARGAGRVSSTAMPVAVDGPALVTTSS
jgi:hypothetical protein